MAGPRLCYDHGAYYGYTLQAQAVAFAYRLYLQAIPTVYTYRLYVRYGRVERRPTFSKCIPFLRSSSSRCMR